MFNKLIVSAYKIFGFIILATILLGLGSYLVINGFYYSTSSWIAPIIVSPSDKRVLDLNAELAQQQSLRDALVTHRAELQSKQRDAERIAAAEKAYQNGLRLSIKADLDEQRYTLGRLGGLRTKYAKAHGQIASANEEFASFSKKQTHEMFDAHLTTRDEVIKNNMQVASLANLNLGLDERAVALDGQVAASRRQAESLAAVEALIRTPGSGLATQSPNVAFASGDSGVAPTREVLSFQRQFELSVLATKRAEEEVESIKQSIAAADTTLQRYDALLASIKESPFLTAIDHHLTIGFVPYTNTMNAKEGTPVFACRGNIVWCRRVGVVGAPLKGEMTGTHPVQKIDLRGRMVRLDLSEDHAAEEAILHVGRAPLFF